MTKKEKHTRGPWLNWETLEWRYEPRKLLESTANALLIGAAPELLETAEALLIANKIARAAEDDWQRHIGHDDVYGTIALGQAYEEAQAAVIVCEDALRSIIAKIRGSS